jgi:DNA replication protein DnaC
MRGYSVLFATIQHLASQLSAAMADLSIEKLIDQYVSADLIILDELGFTPLNKVVADHIFRIVSERYERGAIIVTSNKPFELWGEMFADPILATAVLDRLVHHAHIIPIAGESYRTRDRRPPATEPPAAQKPSPRPKNGVKSAPTTRLPAGG